MNEPLRMDPTLADSLGVLSYEASVALVLRGPHQPCLKVDDGNPCFLRLWPQNPIPVKTIRDVGLDPDRMR